jgi:hypothetical protein
VLTSNYLVVAEGKIKMYHSLTATHGAPAGERRQAIDKLQDQLKQNQTGPKSS